MTFDGNNEVSFEVNLSDIEYGDWSRGEIKVFLDVCEETIYSDCLQFANKVWSGRSAYIGRYVYDKDKTIKINSVPKSVQKQNAPFVQRERHNAIIRDGNKRYRANGATSR